MLKRISPSMLANIALTLALGAAGLHINGLRADIDLQNQRIEMFKSEAYLMSESLKKYKAEAVKLRAGQ